MAGSETTRRAGAEVLLDDERDRAAQPRLAGGHVGTMRVVGVRQRPLPHARPRRRARGDPRRRRPPRSPRSLRAPGPKSGRRSRSPGIGPCARAIRSHARPRVSASRSRSWNCIAGRAPAAGAPRPSPRGSSPPPRNPTRTVPSIRGRRMGTGPVLVHADVAELAGHRVPAVHELTVHQHADADPFETVTATR